MARFAHFHTTRAHLTNAMKFRLVFCVWLVSVTSLWTAGATTELNISRMDAGKPAPAFVLPDLQGEHIDSQSLSGQVVMLNFWATWCGPCKEEMPSLERLRRRLKSEPFRLFAVTTDIRPQDIAAFWKHLDLHIDVLLDEQENLSQALMVRNLPTTIIIDKNGRIVGRMMGLRDWESPEAKAFIDNLLQLP